MGRPAGIYKFKYDVTKICQEAGFNPFEKLIDLAMNARSEKIQCEATSELASYVAPKLKQIEHKGDNASMFIVKLDLSGKDKKEINVIEQNILP